MTDSDEIEEDEVKGFVRCDIRCQAKDEPNTLEEYIAAYEHWRKHRFLSGCSHAR